MLSHLFGIRDPFSMMELQLDNMRSLANSGACTYSFSSVVMTSDQNGKPQIYESTSSSKIRPDGTKETRSTVRDSSTGLHKMSIGHHINDRAHIMQRSKNVYTGDEEEEDNCINIDEDETEQFENEWKSRMGAPMAYRGNSLAAPRNHATLALPAPRAGPSYDDLQITSNRKKQMNGTNRRCGNPCPSPIPRLCPTKSKKKGSKQGNKRQK